LARNKSLSACEILYYINVILNLQKARLRVSTFYGDKLFIERKQTTRINRKLEDFKMMDAFIKNAEVILL